MLAAIVLNENKQYNKYVLEFEFGLGNKFQVGRHGGFFSAGNQTRGCDG